MSRLRGKKETHTAEVKKFLKNLESPAKYWTL